MKKAAWAVLLIAIGAGLALGGGPLWSWLASVEWNLWKVATIILGAACVVLILFVIALASLLSDFGKAAHSILRRWL